MARFTEYGNRPAGSIKGEFLVRLNDNQLLKKNFFEGVSYLLPDINQNTQSGTFFYSRAKVKSR
jgi:hypothetical protein